MLFLEPLDLGLDHRSDKEEANQVLSMDGWRRIADLDFNFDHAKLDYLCGEDGADHPH